MGHFDSSARRSTSSTAVASYAGRVGEARRGLGLGVTAYLLWGAFPLYWPLLEPADAVEILAHRILWSLAAMGLLVLLTGRAALVREAVRDRRLRWLLAGAGVAVTVNWVTYIYGVTSGRVVETSLGYFINPLVTVLLGVFVLRERLRPLQWAALGVGFAAVCVLTWDYGRLPYIALVLAFSFGGYGLAKKTADVGAVESLVVETGVVAPAAAAYLLWLGVSGSGTFTHHGPGHALLLVGSGLVTAVPLLCFGGAATRVSMTTLGLLQYLAPTLQFLLGVLVFDEAMTVVRWAGFVLVWLALALFTSEALAHRRRQLALTAEAAAV